MRRIALAGTFVLTFGLAVAGAIDDMDLRSNVEISIRGAAQTANLHLKIQVENGIAIPDGLVHDLNQADDVADLAAKVRGITAVDRSRLRLEFTARSDDELAARVNGTLFEVPKYASSSMKIGVENGVVTLTGAIKNAAWRGDIRRLCGGVEGVVDVLDRLETPETSDDRIQKVLDGVFGVRVLPRFPGYVRAVSQAGVVTLDGHVPRLYDKQSAEHIAQRINGVRRVDDRLELRSATAVQVIRP